MSEYKCISVNNEDVIVNFNDPVSVEYEMKCSPVHPGDLSYKEHSHNFTELALICSGQGTYVLEGKKFPISAGDVFVVQDDQKHCFEGTGFTLMNVMYNSSEINLPESRLSQMPGYRALFQLEPMQRDLHGFSGHLHLGPAALGHAERLGLAIEREVEEKQAGFDIAAISLLKELIVFLSRTYMKSNTTEMTALLSMGELLGVLEKKFEQSWTIEQMQEVAHMSRSGLIRTFRKATGLSPVGYLIALRLQQAMRLLVESDFNITEIAFECGFNDSSYFTRQFNKIYNITPRDYRKQYAVAV